MSCAGIRWCGIANGSTAAAASRSAPWIGKVLEVAFDASCACALSSAFRSPGKTPEPSPNCSDNPTTANPVDTSEHERPAPETTTILLASRWISAAEKSIKKAGQHAL